MFTKLSTCTASMWPRFLGLVAMPLDRDMKTDCLPAQFKRTGSWGNRQGWPLTLHTWTPACPWTLKMKSSRTDRRYTCGARGTSTCAGRPSSLSWTKQMRHRPPSMGSTSPRFTSRTVNSTAFPNSTTALRTCYGWGATTMLLRLLEPPRIIVQQSGQSCGNALTEGCTPLTPTSTGSSISASNPPGCLRCSTGASRFLSTTEVWRRPCKFTTRRFSGRSEQSSIGPASYP